MWKNEKRPFIILPDPKKYKPTRQITLSLIYKSNMPQQALAP